MRLAFTVHKFPPESLGGTEIYTESLASALAELGHEVHLFFPSEQSEQSDAPAQKNGVHLWTVAVPTERWETDPARQFWQTFRDTRIEAKFVAFLNQVQPEIVHFQHVQGVSAKLTELACRVPRVITFHDYWYFCANSQLVRPDRTPCNGPSAGCRNCVDCATARAELQWLRTLRPVVALPLAYRNSYLRKMTTGVDLFIAPSEFLRQQYIRQGFPADRILMVENGIATERLATSTGQPVQNPDGRPHFGFLGTLAWQKGVHILVEAFNALPERAALTIYGSETAFPEYVAEVKALARHPHIRFAGAIDPDRVGDALRSFDCLVTPSLWYENSPLVIQEAFSAQVPVVASDLGAMPEKVQDGVTGALFPPGDSTALADLLLQLVDHPETLNTWKENIRPGPSMRDHADLLVSQYENLLATRAPSRQAITV